MPKVSKKNLRVIAESILKNVFKYIPKKNSEVISTEFTGKLQEMAKGIT